MEIACPACGKRGSLAGPVGNTNRRVRCPACKQPFLVPADPAAWPSAPPPPPVRDGFEDGAEVTATEGPGAFLSLELSGLDDPCRIGSAYHARGTKRSAAGRGSTRRPPGDSTAVSRGEPPTAGTPGTGQAGKLQRISLVAIAVVGAVGAFLPWWHFPLVGEGPASVEEYAVLLGLFVASAVVAAVAGDRSSPLASGYCVALALGAAAGGLWLLYNVGDFLEQLKGLSGRLDRAGFSGDRDWAQGGIGIGVYLEGAACVAIFLCCTLFPRVKK